MPPDQTLQRDVPALDEIFGLELEIAEHHETELRRRSAGGEPPRVLLHEALAELRTLTGVMRGMRHEIRSRTSQLRRLQEDVHRERQRYRELLRSSPVAFLVTDAHGVIRDANPAAEGLFHRTAEHLVHRPITDFLPRGDVIQFETQLHAALASAETRTRWETHLGSEHALAEPVGVTMNAARDRNGRIDHLRWCLIRLSDRRRAEQSERALQREKTARMEAERLAARFHFISAIERAFARQPADPAAALREVLVPAFADACALLDPDDLERVFGRLVDVLSPTRAVFVPGVDARCMPGAAPPSENQHQAMAFAIFAPIRLPPTSAAVLVLLGWGERHPFGPDDVLLAELITARIAIHPPAPIPLRPLLPHR
jgi:PAS domain S-box-containing protein